MFPEFTWLTVKDGDPRAFRLYSRHYSFRRYADKRRADPTNPNRFQFVGPGEKMVLLTFDCQALFVWRKYINDAGQTGVNCAVFRNEGPHLSSFLIQEAEILAWARWPNSRLYTYVNPGKIRSVNPGVCFKMAGWTVAGRSAKGLVILERYPTANNGGPAG